MQGAILNSTGYPADVIERVAAQLQVSLLLLHGTADGRRRPAWRVFNDLFKQLPAGLILRFLAEETSLLEEFRLTNVMDKPTFISAALREAIV